MVAGAIVGVFFGAAFATEASRRGRAEERRERERLVEDLQGSIEKQIEEISLLKTDAESQVTAAHVLEQAKTTLEKKVTEVSKELFFAGFSLRFRSFCSLFFPTPSLSIGGKEERVTD